MVTTEGRLDVAAIERRVRTSAARLARKPTEAKRRELVLQWAEFWKELIIAMGGEPFTGYAVAGEWCRGLLTVETIRKGGSK